MQRETRKKPPARVIALSGEHDPDRITQEELKKLEALQRMEWAASKRAALMSEHIKTRLKHGAKIESGPLYFDHELEMVRSRKRKAAG